MSKYWFDKKTREQKRHQRELNQKRIRQLNGIPEPEVVSSVTTTANAHTVAFSSGISFTELANWSIVNESDYQTRRQFEKYYVKNNIIYASSHHTSNIVYNRAEPPPLVDYVPILAQRYAGLKRCRDGGFVFKPLGASHGVFGVDEDAVCRTTRCSWELVNTITDRHAAPAWHCTCGFYAMPTGKLPYELDKLILQVELSGVVIIHDLGYRAEHQRVLEVKVPDCHCGAPSTILSMGQTSNNLEGVYCNTHGDPYVRDYRYQLSYASKKLGIPFTRYEA